MGAPNRPRLLLVAPAVIALALVAAACGGSPPPSGVANLGSTTTTAPATGSALVEYARCMRSHGVSSFPDASSFGSDAAIRSAKGQIYRVAQSERSSPAFQHAQRTCARYAPSGEPSTRVTPEELRRLLAVSHCMRTHGVANFPDPNPITGNLGRPPGTSSSSPVVIAALRACSALGRAAGLGPPSTGQ